MKNAFQTIDDLEHDEIWLLQHGSEEGLSSDEINLKLQKLQATKRKLLAKVGKNN